LFLLYTKRHRSTEKPLNQRISGANAGRGNILRGMFLTPWRSIGKAEGLMTADSLQRLSYLEWPLPLFLLIGLVGLVRAWRQCKKGSKPWLLTISTAGILLLSMNLVAWILSRPLEIWYEDGPIPKESAEAIVILAGAVHPASPNQPYTVAGQDTYRRLQHGI